MTAYKTYSDLIRQVSVLVDASMETGLDLLEREGPGFPDQLGHLYLFRASLTNRLGRRTEAIAILREARAAEIRMPARVLRGSKGLASLAGDPSFEALVGQFDHAYATALASGTTRSVVIRPKGSPPQTGWPVTIALHGNNSTPERERDQWLAAVESGWILVMPASRQPAWTPGVLIWDDRELALQDATISLKRIDAEEQVDPARIVMAGFSAGGLRAIEAALGPASQASGLFTVAAFLTQELIDALPFAPTSDRPQVHLVIGELDTSLNWNRVLVDRLNDAGITAELDIRPALGHIYPPDMHHTLESFLGRI